MLGDKGRTQRSLKTEAVGDGQRKVELRLFPREGGR